MVYKAEGSGRAAKSSRRKTSRLYGHTIGGRGANAQSVIFNPAVNARPGTGPAPSDPYLFDPSGMNVAPQTTMEPNPTRRPQRVAPPVTMQAKPKQKQPGILDQLLQSMLTDSASQSFDYESAIKQTEQALRQSYGAEIGAIRSNNRAARRTTAKNRRQIEAMYNGLAQTYGRQAQASNKEGDRQAQGMMNLANSTNAQITKNSQAVTQSEADMLNGLGLQATADKIIAPDYQNLQKVNKQVSQQGQKDASVAKQMGAIDARYFTRGGAGVQFEGTNRSADLLAQLQDYVRQNRDQIAGLRGKEAVDLAKNKQDIMSQAADAQAKADAQNWQHMLDIANLKSNIENTNFDNRLAARKFQYQQRKDAQQGSGSTTSYLPKNLTNAVKILGPQKAGKLLPLLESIWGTEQFKTQKFSRTYKNGQSQSFNMTPFEAAAIAERAGRKAGLSAAEINTLKLAAMASVK